MMALIHLAADKSSLAIDTYFFAEHHVAHALFGYVAECLSLLWSVYTG